MKKMIVVIFIVCFILATIIFLNFTIKKNDFNNDKIKCINLSTDYELDQALIDLNDLNANTVNVPVVINIPNINSNNMQIDSNSKSKAIQLIKELKSKNIKIILEPYPWIKNGSEYETEYNPYDKNRFFEDWKDILNILIKDIANKYNIDAMIVASSFSKLEMYENQWCQIIDFIKNEFNGKVTYKTSWWYTAKWDKDSIKNYNKKLNNKIFSKVDFISIAAYFELSDKKENSVDELVKALRSSNIYNREQNIVDEIYRFYKKYKKPIYFAELGFPRKDYAAMHPWDSEVSNSYNNNEQARCFQAYKIAFENKEYIKGFSIFALGENGKDKNFYPSKESKSIISSWYEN